MSPTGLFLIHVMKTGGTSLALALQQRFAPDDVYPPTDAPFGYKSSLDWAEDAGPPGTFGLYAVHMPAWTADRLAPDHRTATVLRDPVDRTLSHLRHIAAAMPEAPTDLTAIYERPAYRSRLSEYQTYVFAHGPDDHRADLEVIGDPLPDDDDVDAVDEVRAAMLTGIPRPLEIDDQRLVTAEARLRAVDAVGVTEDLESFGDRLGEHLGGASLPVPVANTTERRAAVPDRLVEMIEGDTRGDAHLHTLARRLAAA